MASNKRHTRFAARTIALTVGAWLIAVPAFAEPTAAEKESARTLMSQGRSRRAESDLRGALSSFIAADAIMRVATTGFEVARTQASLGQLVEARETIRRILRLPVRADDPPPFAEARANAERLDADLAPRIPSIRIELRGTVNPLALTIELDGTPIPAHAIGDPLKINPGHHVVVVRLGDATTRGETEVAEGQKGLLAIDAPAAASVADTAPSERRAPPPERRTSPGRSSSAPAVSPLVYVGFGVAAVGASIGAVSGLLSLSATNRAKATCEDTRCPAITRDDLESARSTATISNIGFAIAGAGLVVGLGALLLESPASPKPTTTGLRVEPWVGATSGGVRGTF
ncbi:MAG: hypothetical protein ABW133_25100 [Polyangiaceae bacterium]